MANIAFQLWSDVVHWFENADTRQMRYSLEALRILGRSGRIVRFMSGIKKYDDFTSGVSET